MGTAGRGSRGSRQLPALTAAERAAVRTPEQACAEGEGDEGLCRFLSAPRAPRPLEMKALFLGPRGENAPRLEALLVRALRDNAAWRRAFHPGDLPVVSDEDAASAGFTRFWEGFEEELFALLEELKADVPFHSPRYLGHFLGDTALPALAASIATLLYNPNNVSWEVSPITTLLEVEVARELAAMVGFGRGAEELARTWGHVTSGGTVANIEALWAAKAARYLPLAVRAAALESGLSGLPVRPGGPPVGSATSWELAGLPLAAALDLEERYVRAFVEACPDMAPAEAAGRAAARLRAHDVLTLGDQAFAASLGEGDRLGPPVLVASQTMHYSWKKAAGLAGLGSASIWPVPVDRRFRLDAAALRARLRQAAAERRPVLMAVAVCGTTEEGAVDPVHEVVRLREELRAEGLDFFLHCDAAYGGYLAACFRDERLGLRPIEAMRADYGGWPEAEVYDAFAALSEVDSLTVDPHKLGFVPYPAGAVVFRDGRCRELLSQEAPYVFDAEEPGRSQGPSIGRYILEGSKPGSAAAAVCLAHRVIPLDERGYGALLGRLVGLARTFEARLGEVARRLEGRFVVAPIASPDTNVVDYLVNAAGNDRLDVMNRLALSLYAQLSIAPQEPLNARRFLVSHTALTSEAYAPEVVRPLLEERAGVRGAYYVGTDELCELRRASAATGHDDRVVVLRSAMMSPFALEPARGDRTYLDFFFDDLATFLEGGRVSSEA